jgi:hypothetical protein
MREFGDKYKGDVQAALRGLQRERMGVGAEAGAGSRSGDIEIDKSTRKRKWVASVEAEAEGSQRLKNGVFDSVLLPAGLLTLFIARMMSTSPKKKPGSSTGPGTAQHARLIASNKTPGTVRVTLLSELIYTEKKFHSQERWDASPPPQALPNIRVQPTHHAPHLPPNLTRPPPPQTQNKHVPLQHQHSTPTYPRPPDSHLIPTPMRMPTPTVSYPQPQRASQDGMRIC